MLWYRDGKDASVQFNVLLCPRYQANAWLHTKSHCILLRRLLAGLHKCVFAAVHCTIATPKCFCCHLDQVPLHVYSPEKLLIAPDLSGTLLSMSWLRQLL